jgi:hypothetical protein
MDLLINFGYGYDYKRWVDVNDDGKYDDFFGTSDWKEIEHKYKNNEIGFRANELINLYISQLIKIGYKSPPSTLEYKNRFLIYNTKNSLQYYLIFVSKHERGYDFCMKVRKYAIEQQEFDLS